MEKTETFYAHSIDGNLNEDEWHLLEDHLQETAELSKKFAEKFHSGDWGYLAGLWHDLGKYSVEFQHRLRGGKKVDHATAGAKHAGFVLPKAAARILAYIISGHHTGLQDGKNNDEACLLKRLEKKIPDFSAKPDSILNFKKVPDFPFNVKLSNEEEKDRFAFRLSFFIRMVFSCLVDADFLDTEEFFDKDKCSWRKGYPSLKELYPKLEAELERKMNQVEPSKINTLRREILGACQKSAEKPTGLFSLTVPTGGGKTLSSLAFAMKHANLHNKERIIYVIPYTSIIEQNAGVFRDIFGNGAVLEHHSNFLPDNDDNRSKLASENWDAPLIVTTNVQFFESLFANRTSKSRKIHNIANSVIILDEAQMLPAPFLLPCLETLKEISAVYDSTVVLCTATQPALDYSDNFKNGLKNVTEIAPDPSRLYEEFRRVATENLGDLTDDELVERVAGFRQVLCIVNTRKQARILCEKISEKVESIHLSALMCPAHRSKVLNKIREKLKNGTECRVISTQLVEAGVDLDFPVVYRCIAGIDSIAQAAGRCNREGRLSEKGHVYVFNPETRIPAGFLRQSADTASIVLRHHEDPLCLESVNEYFSRLYWQKGDKLDEKGILADLNEGKTDILFPFEGIAGKFRIIEEDTEPVIVNWQGTASCIIHGLRFSEFPAPFARQAQRVSIQIPNKIREQHIKLGNIELIKDRYAVLINSSLYDEKFGLDLSNPYHHEPESLVF
ncbi:CRISPR-associated helicase/endonuclease Cas3 [Desulforegula conservatrix]|uniref:CRISPR-associated helicase/endonuclease Cas3 n=1 Tax=Desulforegula conservatrix TaxID=153026 RepID=UPI00042601D6|nr:CRISPR-associated helicase/endonuclease Cas3 [Desulforegula conservatrix]